MFLEWSDFDCFHRLANKTGKGLGLLYTTVYHGKKLKTEPMMRSHKPWHIVIQYLLS
jgi:hypothetical protein